MLSYRHGFHAGNSADVLKHWVIERILSYLTQKDKPCFYCDTHAGAGMYFLNSAISNKTAEYQRGVKKLFGGAAAPLPFSRYLSLLGQCEAEVGSDAYPGSPWWAASVLRATDRLNLCELHPQDYPQLVQLFKRDKRVKVFNEDGFIKSIALMPPLEKRGLVVIDPSYEIKTDYEKVVQHIVALHKRFSTGTYALWYPVVDAVRVAKLEQRFIQAGLKNTQLFELQTELPINGGMYASGMIVVNAPWTLTTDAQEVLPWLSECLSSAAVKAQGKEAGFRLKTLCGE